LNPFLFPSLLPGDDGDNGNAMLVPFWGFM
jgi:hypothetical protein